VNSYSPAGELLEHVRIDALQATCPAFVGPDLDTLAITSAREGVDTELDHSGSIFFAVVGATGLREPRWRGNTSTPYWKRELA